jgi:hypothetical protein
MKILLAILQLQPGGVATPPRTCLRSLVTSPGFSYLFQGTFLFPVAKKKSIVLDLRLARLDEFHRLFLFFILFLSTARPPYQPWISQPRHAFLAAH